MTEENQANEEVNLNEDTVDTENNVPEVNQLELLKSRAELMGISYHPSIKEETLAKKIKDHMEAAEKVEEQAAPTPPAAVASTVTTKEETENQRRQRLRREANELVRVRITCMNPAKREWEGEIFSAGNSVVGTLTKYVPYNNDEGWHVPSIILKQIEARMCQIFVSERDSRGNSQRKGKQIREFAVERLPSLNKKELQELAQRQAMAKGTAS